jgi:hypothetical protein
MKKYIAKGSLAARAANEMLVMNDRKCGRVIGNALDKGDEAPAQP